VRSTTRGGSRFRFRHSAGGIITFTLLGVMLFFKQCPALEEWPHFFPDDPVLEDEDRFSIPEPNEVELSQFYDFLENTFFHPGGNKRLPAVNRNTLNEVPNSSWFVNRHGSERMPLDELIRGPKTGSGPDTGTTWTIIRGKSEGVTPGFVIRDSKGKVYFIKIDPKGSVEMATSSEAVCTPLFHAIGYHVPENYVMEIDTGMLKVGEEATIKNEYGTKRKMTEEDLLTILEKSPVKPDGTLRIIASKGIDGQPLGHFKYYGTRPDDANDVIPHQHRRELRGLRVFSAWLNHDDTRSINSLDVYTREGYIRHYLIDFGSCLGSGSVKPQTLRAGNEYMWEAGPTFKTMLTLGLWVRPYLKTEYPDYPSIGRFESRVFRPELWRPEYPNPAFDLMDDADGFWAAKIIMSFTNKEIEAVVRTAMLSDEEAEEYLIRTLVERRDKIGEYYLNLLNPCDGFKVSGSTLYFSNLSVNYGFGDPPRGYTSTWWFYDNQNMVPAEEIEGPVTYRDTLVNLPFALSESPAGTFCFVEISSTDDAPESWQKPVRVFFRKTDSGMKTVGIYRIQSLNRKGISYDQRRDQ